MEHDSDKVLKNVVIKSILEESQRLLFSKENFHFDNKISMGPIIIIDINWIDDTSHLAKTSTVIFFAEEKKNLQFKLKSKWIKISCGILHKIAFIKNK